MPSRRPSRSSAQCRQSRRAWSGSGSARNAPSAAPNSGVGSNGARPSASTSTSALSRSPRSQAKRAAIAAAEGVPDQRRRRRAGALDQVAEPGEHPAGVERAVQHLGAALAGQVRRDHAMAGHQLREHAHPVGGAAARPVEQHERRALAALEHGGGDPGQQDLVLRRGDLGQQPPSCVLSRSRSWPATLGPRRRAPHRRNHPTSAAPAAWVISPSQTSWCS